MPVFALIVADQLTKRKDKWLSVYARCWQIFIAVGMLVLGALPLLGKLIPVLSETIPPRSGAVLLNFSGLHVVVLCVAGVLFGINYLALFNLS